MLSYNEPINITKNFQNKRKLQYQKKNITLDAFHKEQIKSFMNNEFDKIQFHNNHNFKFMNLNKKFLININKNKGQQNLHKINQQSNNTTKNKNDVINKIKNEEINYFMNLSKILFDYYNIDKKINNMYNKTNKNNRNNQNNKSGNFNNLSNNNIINNNSVDILDIFNQAQQSNNSNQIKNFNNDNNLFENIDYTQNKSDLYEQYLSIYDKYYINKEISYVNYCHSCNSTNIVINENAISYCDNCSCIINITIDTDKPSYKEPQKEISYLNYKRKNHFNECLNQIQGKEITDIPQKVFDLIYIELRKLKIMDSNNNLIGCTTIKYEILREILKKIKLNKYYEHIAYIHYRITGISSSLIPNDLIEKLKNMFELIQNPFYKYCPNTRKSFLSYSYCIHKMFQILGETEYIKYFPLLKNREKLYLHEKIWKKICNDLGWTFIPSM